MQAILGEVDVLSNAAPLASTNVNLNDSTDSVRRTIHLASDVNGNTLISGMAPGLIKLVGARFGPTLTGGIGGSDFHVDTQASPFFSIVGGSTTDLLAGSDTSNVWQIYGSNLISLNSNVYANNIASILGGAAADTFNFVSGPISGNLDGGPGIDTLTYANYAAWHGVPFDLAHGIALWLPESPATSKWCRSRWPIPAIRQSRAGVPISPLQFSVLGGLGAFTYSASGLPAGLSIDQHSGQVTGTILESAVSGSPYAVHVSATDGFNTAAVNFQWTVQPGILVTNPGDQTTPVRPPRIWPSKRPAFTDCR